MGANVVTILGFALIWFLKNKCKHSNCTCTLKCCKCHFDDEEDEDDECSHDSIKGDETRRIHQEAESQV